MDIYIKIGIILNEFNMLEKALALYFNKMKTAYQDLFR